jgi:hypothetical protein
MPNIPDIKPNKTVKQDDAVNVLLISIALEELAQAHILNAEGEKIQYAISVQNKPLHGGPPIPPPPPTPPVNLLEVNKSVVSMIRAIIKNQMLLQFKLEDTIDLIKKGPKCC